MDFGIYDILNLLGALAFFIYGMKVMSEGIQKAAGSKLRQILGAMTKNRYFGVMTGFLITALVQSSSVTTVMTVSFVNAGLLTLLESAGVMMGANIGTTITGWLVSIIGFKVKISAIALPILAVGMGLIFIKKGNIRFWGEFMIGFALLFLGLGELKSAVPDIKGNPEVLSFLAGYADMGILSAMMFVGVGALLTVVIQSSSAAMTLTFVMAFNGWIPFEVAAPMVLGENIGTTITAELASLVGNVHAKRSARIHSMFNIVGVCWMLLAYPFFLQAIDYVMVNWSGEPSPFESTESIPMALSYFHTSFNLTNVFLLIWFVPFLVKIAERTVKSKGEDDEQFSLEYIGGGVMATTELSLLEARKEVAKFGEITKRMNDFIRELLQEKEVKKSAKLIKRIKKYEDITDRIEVEVGDYLLKISSGEMSDMTSVRVRSMLSIISELERVGDIFYQVSKNIERKLESKAWFTPEQRKNLMDMLDLLDEAFNVMIENLNSDYDKVSIEKASEMETRINKFRNNLRKEHIKSIEQGDYNIQNGMIYVDLYSSFEKVGDHVINVTEAVTGEI